MNQWEWSDQHDKVFAGYLKALAAGIEVRKSKDGGGGSKVYKYATLDDVYGSVEAALAASGVRISQIPSGSMDGAVWTLTTVLWADPDQWMAFAPIVRPQIKDEQGFGSSQTYNRRYQLLALFSLVPIDDDGHEATTQQRNQQQYDGNRSAQELAVRTLMAEYPDRRAEFAEAFKTRFGKTLADLNVNKHAEALVWTAEWFALSPGADPEPTQEELS